MARLKKEGITPDDWIQMDSNMLKISRVMRLHRKEWLIGICHVCVDFVNLEDLALLQKPLLGSTWIRTSSEIQRTQGELLQVG